MNDMFEEFDEDPDYFEDTSPYDDYNYRNHRPPCPNCASANIIALNKKSVFCASIAGILGGLITGAIAFISHFGKKQTVSAAVIGIFSGISVGTRFGQSKKNTASEKVFLCLDCFHFFKRGELKFQENQLEKEY
ncbi:hypothetical protein AGMMS50212_15060 [Spirochaetia bacterium]|nr:hypothetical protein AGMMS50212_15060 [Spirochaetia bacterium]